MVVIESRLRAPICRQNGNPKSGINSPVEGKVVGDVYPIIYRVSYISGGCLGFQPSTILRVDERSFFLNIERNTSSNTLAFFLDKEKNAHFCQKNNIPSFN